MIETATSAFLTQVQEPAPMIEASADASERSRRLAMPVVEAMSQTGLFRLWVPRSLGGAEVDIATVVQVVEAVSRIDGAAGWCLTIAGNTSLPAGYRPSLAARDIFASDPLLVTAGSCAPFGQDVAAATALLDDGRSRAAVSMPDGYRAAAGLSTAISRAWRSTAGRRFACCCFPPRHAKSLTLGHFRDARYRKP